MWQPRKQGLFPEESIASQARQTLIKYINEIEYPECNKLYNKSGKVYYLKIWNEAHSLYKIGFTQDSVRNRIASLNIPKIYSVKVIQVLSCRKGVQAWLIEGLFHKEFKEYRYKGLPIFNFNNGNTEVYSKDVLGLDGCVYREVGFSFEELLKEKKLG